MSLDPNRVETIFNRALAIAPADRPAFLVAECADDAELRACVERLLVAHDDLPDLRHPVADPPGTIEAPKGPPANTAEHTATARTVVAGKYKLIEEIGEGGMGSVWMAQQTEPVKRTVAVKLIKAGMGSRAVLARFEAERQALAMMDHPNIAKVLDAGATVEGHPFFVMELVKGVPITKFCDDRKLTPRERLELFVPVCQAIQHAHQKGIIHRDIKPSNVLVALHDDKPVPKVIDFGVAKATGTPLTEKTLHTGFEQVVGTPAYMSPEQASFNNLDIDTRSDVYSLGVLLYELLAGSPPFSKQELEKLGQLEILRVIREQEPPRPSTKLSTADALPTLSANRGTEPKRLAALLRGELDWIVMKALEKDRSRRYATANGFAKDVERYLAGEPVQAVPPSAGYRLRKLLRKNRGPVIAASVVFLALVAGIAGTAWGLVRALDAEKLAKNEEKKARDERDEKEKARAAAAEARQLAEDEKKVAQAVRDFLQHKLLGQADVRAQEDGLLRAGALAVEARNNPTIRELLDRAAEELTPDRIEQNFPNQPLLQAELLQTVGDTCRSVGKFSLAVKFLERAAALRLEKRGADDPDTLTSLNYLALAHQDAGELKKAIPLLEQVRNAREKKLGADHRDTLTSLNNLAVAYLAVGKHKEAIDLLVQVRIAQEKKSAEERNHAEYLVMLANLAVAYRANRQLGEAIPLLEQVRKAQEKKPGADHPDTLTTLNNLAGAYRANGEVTKAIRLYEHVRPAFVKKWSEDHPATLTLLNNLAVAYQADKRLWEAICLLQQVRATVDEQKLPANHPLTLATLGNLASAYVDAEMLDEALPLFQQVAREIEKLKFQHEHAGKTVINLIICHERLMEFKQAAEWRRKWTAVVKERAGADSLPYAQELSGLGANLLQQKKWGDAKTVLGECLVIRVKKQPDDWSTFNTQSKLGGALLGLKEYAKAEPLLLDGYQGMKQREGKIPPLGKERLPEALDSLIDLYIAWDKPGEVAKWLAVRVAESLPREVKR